jgi:hypothetical protein
MVVKKNVSALLLIWSVAHISMRDITPASLLKGEVL